MSETSTNNGSSREIISDDYRGMRQRYGVDEVPGRQMGKFSPLCEDKKPQFFSMRTQLVTDGRSVNPLAETENLWAWIKVYASGGENTLHAHNNEDHMFVILQGTAIFHGPNDEEKRSVQMKELCCPPARCITSLALAEPLGFAEGGFQGTFR